MTGPIAPAPDTKDWTWVLGRPCPACGFAASALERPAIAPTLSDVAGRIAARLTEPDANRRPSPEVWSPLEYACHVRDVCQLFGERVHLMLTQDDPRFDNWDQDETAVTDRYWMQGAATVALQLADAARHTGATFAAVQGDQWDRTGRRSNGSEFTVDTLGRYFLHDVVHHAWDIGAGDRSTPA